MFRILEGIVRDIIDLFDFKSDAEDDLARKIDEQSKMIEILLDKIKELEEENDRLNGC